MDGTSYFQDTQKIYQTSTSAAARHQSRGLPLLPRPGTTLAANQASELPLRDPNDAPLPRRKRASKPKVRSGCLTCKIRRVKCDERKPTCSRCERADVECDGYIKEAVSPKKTAQQQLIILAAQQANRHLLPRPGGSGHRGPAPILAARLRNNPSFLQFDQSDVSYYDLFRYQLIRDLGGSCQADFWSRIVLNESTRDPSYSTVFLNKHHKAALLHHVRAVSIYRERIQASSVDTSPRSVIIMTLLLIAFEFIQGNMKNVDSLMGTGMRLLENKITLLHDLQSGDESGGGEEYLPSQLRSNVPDDEMEDIEHLLPCLCLMAGFTHFFTSHRNSVLLMNSSPKLQLPKPGVTVLAKLQTLWGQFFTRAVVHVMRTVHDQLNYNPMDLIKAAEEQEKFVEYISMWNDVLETYLGDPKIDADTKRTLDSIQIHRLLIHIVISCSLDRSEMMYDMFEQEFRELLSRVIRYLRDPGPISKVSFTFSEGLTSPLAMIIGKCRNHDLRMQGIHVLNNLSWRESAWDGQALVVGKSGVVLLEERGMDENGFIPPGSRWIWMSGKWDIEKRELLATYFRLKPNEDGTPFHAQLTLDMDNLTYSCSLIGCPGRHDPFENHGF
ncbi:C6 zinc finger protein [Colletotrichum tofieldiae]|uniref:C6 zinc finger protein n=1 Tax=Colletotrichum tofieldiae TaxID=708197 RepID=A0A161VPN1_9PEZI|nr:C6 zinc finger protein [Colletotrichum tofieldiae]